MSGAALLQDRSERYFASLRQAIETLTAGTVAERQLALRTAGRRTERFLHTFEVLGVATQDAVATYIAAFNLLSVRCRQFARALGEADGAEAVEHISLMATADLEKALEAALDKPAGD